MQMHCPVQFARAVTLQLLDTVLELARDRNVEYLFYFSTQDLRTTHITQSWSVWSDTYLVAWAHVDHHYISKSYLKNLQVILTDGV